MTLSRDYLAGSFPDAIFDRTTAGSLITGRLTTSIMIFDFTKTSIFVSFPWQTYRLNSLLHAAWLQAVSSFFLAAQHFQSSGPSW